MNTTEQINALVNKYGLSETVKQEIVKIVNSCRFNFDKGDVINFCDELYYVIENNGIKGVVNPIGQNYYIRNFYWNYNGEISYFVRKSTKEELDKLVII